MRPAFPYFEYIINFDYITKVLCINKEKTELNCLGKCYLSEELSKVNNEDNSENKRMPIIEFEKFTKISYDKGDFLNRTFDYSHNFSFRPYKFFIKNFSSKPPTPPPKC